MTHDGDFEGIVSFGGTEAEAQITVGPKELTFRTSGGCRTLDYAELRDFRLLNYHLHLIMEEGEIVLSRMGRETEPFFEQLWLAYDARSREALFIDGTPVQESEGDYALQEGADVRQSKAKVALYPDCLCILPHDEGARRIPLCFLTELRREGFAMDLTLDTGEHYRLARLGHDTDPFFERLCTLQEKAAAKWERAHRALERDLQMRLGPMEPQYRVLAEQGRMALGLFEPDEEEFWFAALGGGKAAVELAVEEKAATYLYRYDVPDEVFLARLRHAMEAVGKNREIIYCGPDTLAEKSHFRMAIRRSSHIRFLREHNAGRGIHNEAWADRLRAFFKAE